MRAAVGPLVKVLDTDTLKKHLSKLDWATEERDANTLRCARETEQGEVPVYLHLSENWLSASVVPFLETGGDNSFELSRWLLRMNRDMKQARFGYDDDGDVTLTLDLPTESISYSELKTALEALVEYAIKYRATLRLAAGA